MSPLMKWGDILFLAPLSVCPSVCPSRFRVRSISFEPLVGFTNNFAQMLSMMRRCAVPMFDQGYICDPILMKLCQIVCFDNI